MDVYEIHASDVGIKQVRKQRICRTAQLFVDSVPVFIYFRNRNAVYLDGRPGMGVQ